MRALLFELRPEPLASEGLIGALLKQVAIRVQQDVTALFLPAMLTKRYKE